MSQTDQRKSKFESFKPLIAGALAGCSAVLLTNPIDVAKTRLQLQGELQRKYVRQINGVVDCLVKTAQYDGILALQKGLVPALGFQIVMNGIRLGMYDNVKKWTGSGYFKNLVSSGLLGFVGGYLGTPFNLIKTRLMLQSNFLESGSRYKYKGFIDGLFTIGKNEGVKGLFKGSILWGSRTGLGSAVQLPIFDKSKELITPHIPGQVGVMMSSAISTFWLCVIMCPIDGLTTRYFNQPFDQHGKGTLYDSAFSGFRKIISIEGPLGLYKGFIALVARVGPHSFLSLVLFTHFMSLMR